MSDRIEAEILDVLGEEVAAAVDTPLVVIEGTKGDPGADGVSPTVSTAATTGGTKVTIPDAKGSHEFVVKDGARGAAGLDGHSPVVTATKSGKTTTISVDGTAIATVEDGADGAPGSRGTDGITPTIGSNGNWYLGGTDTGKPSRGATGAPGKDGVTPHIGDNGNWFLGTTDTGKPSRGEKGDPGAAGKSAYQYAQDGGYTGTETEFAEKLAQEQLTGTTNDITPTQVYNAVSAGIPVKVQYSDDTFGVLSYTNFFFFFSMGIIDANSICVYYGNDILVELSGDKTNNTWNFTTTTLAQKADIPSALPNPNALTFTGAVTGTYNGSEPLSVQIPSAVTDDHINSLIDTKLGVIENGSY